MGREGHERGGRFFGHGDLRFVILALLEERARHGYELIKALEERTGGAYRPSPG
ncbi:MAG TPA: PadR family transcriptional regulator, partial [Phenylobacterium sp.]|nr:PadR family transcriptional regulator [Phenylobacterium sp.]